MQNKYVAPLSFKPRRYGKITYNRWKYIHNGKIYRWHVLKVETSKFLKAFFRNQTMCS